MQDVKVAFVGAGYMASEHAKAFSDLPGVVLVGVHNRTRSRAEQLAENHPGMHVYDSIVELHAESGADLVVITVKELAMRAVAAQCFEFPWKVLLEKPAGYDLEDARAIRYAAQTAGREVYVALNRRAYSSTRRAIECLEQDMDSPRFVTVLDQQDQIAAREVYKEPSEVVQNYMYANSIHLIDYFHTLCRGKVQKVDHVMAWDPSSPGMVVAKITFTSGDIGLYEGNWMGPGPWAVTVATPGRRIELRPLEQATVQLRGERKVTPLPIDRDDSAFKPGLRFQAQHAIAAARGLSHALPSLENSWDSMRLVAAIYGLGDVRF